MPRSRSALTVEPAFRNRRANSTVHGTTSAVESPACLCTCAIVPILFAVARACAAPCRAQSKPAETDSGPMATKHELLEKYVWSTLGAPGALNATLASAFDQWRGKPRDWEEDPGGYISVGRPSLRPSAIGDARRNHAVARLLHQDPSFTRCDCTGFHPRLVHALNSPFTAAALRGERHRVFSPAILAGIVLAATVVPAATWYPAEHGTLDGFAARGNERRPRRHSGQRHPRVRAVSPEIVQLRTLSEQRSPTRRTQRRHGEGQWAQQRRVHHADHRRCPRRCRGRAD